MIIRKLDDIITFGDRITQEGIIEGMCKLLDIKPDGDFVFQYGIYDDVASVFIFQNTGSYWVLAYNAILKYKKEVEMWYCDLYYWFKYADDANDFIYKNYEIKEIDKCEINILNKKVYSIPIYESSVDTDKKVFLGKYFIKHKFNSFDIRAIAVKYDDVDSECVFGIAIFNGDKIDKVRIYSRYTLSPLIMLGKKYYMAYTSMFRSDDLKDNMRLDPADKLYHLGKLSSYPFMSEHIIPREWEGNGISEYIKNGKIIDFFGKDINVFTKIGKEEKTNNLVYISTNNRIIYNYTTTIYLKFDDKDKLVGAKMCHHDNKDYSVVTYNFYGSTFKNLNTAFGE